MRRFFVFIFICLLSLYGQSQITITNKLVQDSLKSRIDAIHTKIYKAVESGELKIYNYNGKVRNPSEVLTKCKNTDSVHCDSFKVSMDNFLNFRFTYLKKFDFEILNTSLTVQSLDLKYRIFFAGIELFGGTPLIFRYSDLPQILDEKDIVFLKYLSLSYNDLYYYRRGDSITSSNGWRTIAQVIEYDDNFIFDEANRSKQAMDTGYSYGIDYDTLTLDIVSKILFYNLEKRIFIKNPIPIFNDKLLKKEINKDNFLHDLFIIEYSHVPIYDSIYNQFYTGVTIPRDETYIKELTFNKQSIKIEFDLYPNSNGKVQEHLVNKPLQTYFIKPEHLEFITGKFQYLFLKNLFGF